MAKRHVLNKEQYDIHSRPLQQLRVGESVQVQNQEGPNPRRWAKTGRVVETMGNRQYRIRLDGSGRITLRNRRFLRKIKPVMDTPEYPPTQQPHQPPPQTPRREDSKPPCNMHEMMEVEEADCDTSETDMEVDQDPINHKPMQTSPVPRRSMRVTRAPRPLSPQMQGPTHYYTEFSSHMTTKRR